MWRTVLAAIVFASVAFRSSFAQGIYPAGNILFPHVLPGKPFTIQMGDDSPTNPNPVYAQETSNLILNCSNWLRAHPGGSLKWYQRVRKGVGQVLNENDPYRLMGSVPLAGAGPPRGPFLTIVEITSATLSSSAAEGNAGNYICEVCVTADKTRVQKCYNATEDVRVTRKLPFTDTKAEPQCLQLSDLDPNNPNTLGLTITCNITNKAADNDVAYEFYLNNSVIVMKGVQKPIDLLTQFIAVQSIGIISVVTNDPAFNPLGVYTCVGSSIWGSTNSTQDIRICNTAPSIASCPQAVQPVVDVSRVPVGCDLCLQAGTAAQLDCTATLGTYHSETAVRYAWSYGNTGISAGVTSPLYTVTGAGQFTCVASNSGLKDTKTSNVYLYVKSQPTITITNGVLRGDPTGCSRLTGVTLTPNTLCPFVGETLTVKCTGEGVTVMKDRVSLNVSTLVQVITGTENTGNYSCGDGGPCDPAQTSRPVVVYNPARVNLEAGLTPGPNTFGAGRIYGAQTISDGSPVTLQCPTSGIDDPNTRWEFITPQDGYRVGTTLPPGVTELNQVIGGLIVSTLTFTFNSSYAGTFVCLTSNVAGSDQGFVVLQQAETFSWQVDAWSACDIDCQDGKRTRRVTCTSDRDGSAVPDVFCRGTPAPPRQQQCNNVSCALFQPLWSGLEWSGCSQDCGGYRTRLVVCIVPQTLKIVSNERCATSPLSGPRPPTTEFCENKCCVEDTYPEFCQQYVKGTNLCQQDRYKQICCCACGLTIKP